MKNVMKKQYYLAPITYNARQYFLAELETKSLRTLSKEIGISVNTLIKIKKEEPVTYSCMEKFIDWADKKRGKTPLSVLLKQTRMENL